MTDRKTVVIMGGANGIGAACCEVMSRHGWSIVIADLDHAAGRETAAKVGGHAFELDISDAAMIEDMADRIDRDIGPVSSLVVSSGIFQANMPIEQTPSDLFERLMAVNVRGTYDANRIFGMRMAHQAGGSIVNLASVTGHGSTPLNIYGPGKAAIISLTKSLAGEWGGRKVRVNSVSPGITLVPRIRARKAEGDRYPADLDDQMALRRCVEPNEVAEAVEFLASDRASGITGTDLVVDCGWMTGALWGAYAGGLR